MQTFIDPVQKHYETYPYPPRKPEDEKHRLIEGYPSHILEIDHYIFGGKIGQQKDIRILIAGGGTGDATIMLAQHLKDRNLTAEIIYLDQSQASLDIAKKRAEIRELTNIKFILNSLEKLPELNLGFFDYIDCCGVLHHLANPAEILMHLKKSLKQYGGIGLMVYGLIGRTGVYELQNALKRLVADQPMATQIDLAKRLLKQLPSTNWFIKNTIVKDHLQAGDSGLYDLLLHHRDQAYTTDQLAHLIDQTDLKIISFIEPWRYNPHYYISDGALLKQLDKLTYIERAALAEELAGNMKIHVCYITHKNNFPPIMNEINDNQAAPILRHRNGLELAKAVKGKDNIQITLDNLPIVFPIPRLSGPILNLIDGKNSLETIYNNLNKKQNLTWDVFKNEFHSLYRVFNAINQMFIYYPN
ncbi:MAG: methyltransferase domain-containing protein [Alphaproteobacteria bacterium]|nr:methyltransferase domain-containing protein [Alphaproteobacteria bacterium]